MVCSARSDGCVSAAAREDCGGEQDGEVAPHPRDSDERYAATQYKRKTALANVLAPYIRAHTDEFVAR
jgi:hypothetical protein